MSDTIIMLLGNREQFYSHDYSNVDLESEFTTLFGKTYHQTV